MHDHWLTGDFGQGLVGEARRFQSCRNDDEALSHDFRQLAREDYPRDTLGQDEFSELQQSDTPYSLTARRKSYTK
jgi:hypothetical protein